MRKLVLRIVTIIALVAIYVSSVSCSAGWSCKKRYVDTTKPYSLTTSKPC